MIRSFTVTVPATGTTPVEDENAEPPAVPGREGPTSEGGILLLRVDPAATADVMVGAPTDATPSLLLRASDTAPTYLQLGPNDVVIAKSATDGTASSLHCLEIVK